MRRDLGGRRFGASRVPMRALSAGTTPRILQDRTVDVPARAGLVAFIRVRPPPDGHVQACPRTPAPVPAPSAPLPDAGVPSGWRSS
ncbi:hypothetical protein ACLBWX_21145 [Methylobacterium sp. M6A4_1b]